MKNDVEKKILDTKISSVMIYQKGCQLTHVGEITLNQGQHVLNITNLPESLDKESVRVKGIGDGKVINITVEFNSTKEYRTEEHKKLQEEREIKEKSIKRNEKDLSRVNELINKFKTTEDLVLNGWAKAFAFGEVEMNNFLEFDDKINENLNSKNDLIESLEDKMKELRKELQVIYNKMSKLGPLEEIHNFYDINLNLDVNKEGKFTIEIRYTMTEAWWVPFYDVSLTENKAKLTMMANVYNRTGLDWNGVDAEISTASLKPINLLRPSPMILQEWVPPPSPAPKMKKKAEMKGRRMDKMDFKEKEVEEEMAEDAFGVYDEAPEPEPNIEETYAEVSDNIGVQSFRLPEKIDIPSDKNPHPVNLTVLELDTEKKYFWSSASPSTVIIRDTLINSDLLLLPGNVKIYYLEEFLGETDIPLIAPKEKFKLGTRISYDLKIEKKLVDRSKDKKAIKGKLKNNYEYKIIIKNLADVSEDLTLYDRVPHADSPSIKVEILSMTPEPKKKQLGVLKWAFNMKGVKEKELQYKYYVEYKKDISITPSLP